MPELEDVEHLTAHLGENRHTKISDGSLERGKERRLSMRRWCQQLGRKKLIEAILVLREERANTI